MKLNTPQAVMRSPACRAESRDCTIHRLPYSKATVHPTRKGDAVISLKDFQTHALPGWKQPSQLVGARRFTLEDRSPIKHELDDRPPTPRGQGPFPGNS